MHTYDDARCSIFCVNRDRLIFEVHQIISRLLRDFFIFSIEKADFFSKIQTFWRKRRPYLCSFFKKVRKADQSPLKRTQSVSLGWLRLVSSLFKCTGVQNSLHSLQCIFLVDFRVPASPHHLWYSLPIVTGTLDTKKRVEGRRRRRRVVRLSNQAGFTGRSQPPGNMITRLVIYLRFGYSFKVFKLNVPDSRPMFSASY